MLQKKEGEEKRVLSIAKTNFSAGNGGFAYLKLIYHIYLLLINGKIKFHEIIVKFMAGLNGIKKYKVIISE